MKYMGDDFFNLFGMKIPVVPDEQVVRGSILMVVRYDEALKPVELHYVTPVHYINCALCNAKCICAPAGKSLIDTKDLMPMCMTCVTEIARTTPVPH
jgi:hypothetical protein